MPSRSAPSRRRSLRPDTAETADGEWPATVTAAILRRGSMVHVVSVVLTIAALLGCATASVFGLGPRSAYLPIGGTIFVVGLVEFWLAARVMLDAELFEAIALRSNDLAGFDRAMR